MYFQDMTSAHPEFFFLIYLVLVYIYQETDLQFNTLFPLNEKTEMSVCFFGFTTSKKEMIRGEKRKKGMLPEREPELDMKNKNENRN